MKRGPAQGNHGLTLAQIAAVEGCSVATVERTLNSAVSKLHKIPGAFSAIVSHIHAVDASHQDPLRAGSAECCTAWINYYLGVHND
jgi:hypothetical protein